MAASSCISRLINLTSRLYDDFQFTYDSTEGKTSNFSHPTIGRVSVSVDSGGEPPQWRIVLRVGTRSELNVGNARAGFELGRDTIRKLSLSGISVLAAQGLVRVAMAAVQQDAPQAPQGQGGSPQGQGASPQASQGDGAPQAPQGEGAPQAPQGEGAPQAPQGEGAPQAPQGEGAPQAIFRFLTSIQRFGFTHEGTEGTISIFSHPTIGRVSVDAVSRGEPPWWRIVMQGRFGEINVGNARTGFELGIDTIERLARLGISETAVRSLVYAAMAAVEHGQDGAPQGGGALQGGGGGGDSDPPQGGFFAWRRRMHKKYPVAAKVVEGVVLVGALWCAWPWLAGALGLRSAAGLVATI